MSDEREIGIEAMMLLAAVGSMVFGLWEEAAALVFLYALAESIEGVTFARSRSAIRDLLDLAPSTRAVRDEPRPEAARAVAELLAVGNGVRAAKRPGPVPATA